jgi:RecA-family ATPase
MQYPEKESAVVGYISVAGFAGVPRSAIVDPDSFVSVLNGVYYAAAHRLHYAKKATTGTTILEAIERDPFLLKVAERTAQESGMVCWRDGLVMADSSLAYNPAGGAIVSEYLADIASAAAQRKATKIGQRLASGDMPVAEALEELKTLAKPRASMVGVEMHTFEELWSYKAEDDSSTLVGNRWLCRGGQLLLLGQSGIGKSSYTLQQAMTWALGMPFFGMKPKRRLRCLIVQAENDMGDMAEVVQGVMSYVVAQSKMTQREAVDILRENVIVARVTAQTGEAFIEVIRELIAKHGPFDLVYGDPLLSFIGDDISQQAVASHFLRELCNPLAFEHGFAWVWSHHTGKPQSDSKSRAHWNANDYAYIGLGSSELTNWARAICVLQTTKHEGIFKVLLAKRGNRAEAMDEHGHPTTDIIIKHAAKGLHWEPAELPEETEEQTQSKGKAGRTPKISAYDEAEIVAKHATWPQGARGFYTEMTAKYGVSRDTIERILRRSKQGAQNLKAA